MSLLLKGIDLLTDKNCKTAQILPLSFRLMRNVVVRVSQVAEKWPVAAVHVCMYVDMYVRQ